MIRFAGRSAVSSLLLASVFLIGGCTTPAPAVTGQTSETTAQSSSWVSVEPSRESVRPHELANDAPKRFADDGDLCALVTGQEIVSITGAPFARVAATEPNAWCRWQLSDTLNDKGVPVAWLMILAHPADLWLGTEQGAVGGHPVRRRAGDGLCLLRVGLREPAGDRHTDRPVMGVMLEVQDAGADVCRSAQSLTELVLDRLPAA
ncbi:hypothetical protein [Saccharothrix australiensis]|uniref:DUF3558 domain-containing protein n=1 Tax=Saccharothrix australiensis TaxID=2072 RepID=A0A495W428_9PSEU|nr:hypothetical protein [Saccharothrix australiensis]RKT55525.1 hypothetical protein C8E97_4194 [Saccharothrix australiensis]